MLQLQKTIGKVFSTVQQKIKLSVFDAFILLFVISCFFLFFIHYSSITYLFFLDVTVLSFLFRPFSCLLSFFFFIPDVYFTFLSTPFLLAQAHQQKTCVEQQLLCLLFLGLPLQLIKVKVRSMVSFSRHADSTIRDH